MNPNDLPERYQQQVRAQASVPRRGSNKVSKRKSTLGVELARAHEGKAIDQRVDVFVHSKRAAYLVEVVITTQTGSIMEMCHHE